MTFDVTSPILIEQTRSANTDGTATRKLSDLLSRVREGVGPLTNENLQCGNLNNDLRGVPRAGGLLCDIHTCWRER